MRQWVIGYSEDLYASMTEIALDVPGPIRKIISGFYIHGNDVTPVPLTPIATAIADDQVQISDPTTTVFPVGRAIQIFIVGVPPNHPVVFLFVEIELEVPGPARPY